ncbi:aminotransferase-like domain-containing protein [Paenibacillus terricola]|nr:PLP-dependent aminotransferase family protein [Paenibacillus terricola]
MDRFSMGEAEEMIPFTNDGITEELVPKEALRAAEASVNAKYGEGVLRGELLGEEVVESLVSLREMIAERMRRQGMTSAFRDGIVLTGGLEQSLDWVVRELTESGDTVLVERPTGLAGLSVLARCGVQVIGVECDEQGPLAEELEKLLVGVVQGEDESKRESESENESAAAKKPRLLYAAPTYGDPTGRVWSVDRRQEVLALCRAHGVVIVEDDTCGELKFHTDAADLSTLYELAGEAGGVMYVNSYEHMIAPSLRVGWIAGERSMMTRVRTNNGGEADDVGDGKDGGGDAANAQNELVGEEDVSRDESDEIGDARSDVFDQLVLAELLRNIDLDAHMRRVADVYRERMYAMQRQLRIQQLAGVKWTEPEGGRSLWLRLPDGLDGDALSRLTRMMGMDIAPGSLFYAEEPQRNTVRLYFTSCSMEEMEQGVAIIAEAIRGFMARWSDD